MAQLSERVMGYQVLVGGRFATREEAEQAVADYQKAYHPCGYGTQLDVFERIPGTFIVGGHRYASCD
jgi:hypothetical protein